MPGAGIFDGDEQAVWKRLHDMCNSGEKYADKVWDAGEKLKAITDKHPQWFQAANVLKRLALVQKPAAFARVMFAMGSVCMASPDTGKDVDDFLKTLRGVQEAAMEARKSDAKVAQDALHRPSAEQHERAFLVRLRNQIPVLDKVCEDAVRDACAREGLPYDPAYEASEEDVSDKATAARIAHHLREVVYANLFRPDNEFTARMRQNPVFRFEVLATTKKVGFVLADLFARERQRYERGTITAEAALRNYRIFEDAEARVFASEAHRAMQHDVFQDPDNLFILLEEYMNRSTPADKLEVLAARINAMPDDVLLSLGKEAFEPKLYA